ncbi:MAG: deoxyribose-phosphate aldolase [Candidatus Izemoplasmatales bacterium]|jgi:deoxyribose-phosphate aldolase|nr:deoxyribose-phosphate aldolase [Candidatus Izemoplasmatales bacterium]MDD4595985.1 deoxyribose-phosphate aldolase [Candidatus Izemoplasmatales bacterium]MDD4988176.1 deoxyribose-phosphate aldolase [Candidatus Izemoplasmatales bacterium]NLF48589.1 deoxyribose-phosphate aldolase [Acholeplasmataceae bacterium]
MIQLTKKEFAAMQDHSILEPFATKEQIAEMVKQTIEYGFNATYVEPCHVAYAVKCSAGKAKVGTVIGFPFGTNAKATKIAEGIQCLADGADALDFVINYSMLKSGEVDYVADELNEFVKVLKSKNPKIVIKVIIECCFLTHDEKVKAIEIVGDSKADFIKTSTGTGSGGCRIGDIRLMRRVLQGKCQIKAAAQITNIEDALAVIEEGATLIGENTAVKLLNDWDKERWTK